MHVSLIKRAIKQFGISTTAINVLFMLDSKLHDQRLLLSGGWFEFRGQSVEFGILAGLDTLVLLGITVKLASSQGKLAEVALVLGSQPPAFPI